MKVIKGISAYQERAEKECRSLLSEGHILVGGLTDKDYFFRAFRHPNGHRVTVTLLVDTLEIRRDGRIVKRECLARSYPPAPALPSCPLDT